MRSHLSKTCCVPAHIAHGTAFLFFHLTQESFDLVAVIRQLLLAFFFFESWSSYLGLAPCCACATWGVQGT